MVRYDADRQTKLSLHTDDGDISFNVLLTDDFEGGGTRFFVDGTEPFAHAEPPMGNVLFHSAQLHHEGVPVVRGTRVILVGFTSVDAIDPFSWQSHGMTWWSSWLNFQWLFVRLQLGYQASTRRINAGLSSKWTDHPSIRSFLRSFGDVVAAVTDATAHQLESLVSRQDEMEYLRAMDAGYRESTNRASWFKGQQINVDLDGKVRSEWITRRTNERRFSEL